MNGTKMKHRLPGGDNLAALTEFGDRLDLQIRLETGTRRVTEFAPFTVRRPSFGAALRSFSRAPNRCFSSPPKQRARAA